jgi:hypothetical protein
LNSKEPDCNRKSDSFSNSLKEEVPSKLGRTRVDGLIDQGWSPPEVAEVGEGDVFWVSARPIDFGGGSTLEKCVSEVSTGEGIGELFKPCDSYILLVEHILAHCGEMRGR